MCKSPPGNTDYRVLFNSYSVPIYNHNLFNKSPNYGHSNKLEITSNKILINIRICLHDHFCTTAALQNSKIVVPIYTLTITDQGLLYHSCCNNISLFLTFIRLTACNF